MGKLKGKVHSFSTLYVHVAAVCIGRENTPFLCDFNVSDRGQNPLFCVKMSTTNNRLWIVSPLTLTGGYMSTFIYTVSRRHLKFNKAKQL